MKLMHAAVLGLAMALGGTAFAADAKMAPTHAAKTQVTWWGHAAFVITTPGGATIAIDPWLKNPKAPQGAQWPAAVDAILVTHGHFDHVGDAAELAQKTGATLVSSFELSAFIDAAKKNPLNQGGSMKVKDATITVVPAVHSSGFGQTMDPGSKPQYGGNPVGYVIAIDHGPTLYHAGDTDVFQEMEYIGERFKPTVAMLPIGGHFTMDPTGAAFAAKKLKVKTVVPMHFGTFPALDGTPKQLEDALKAEKVSAKVQELQPGTAISL